MPYCYNCGKVVENEKDFLCNDCRQKLDVSQKIEVQPSANTIVEPKVKTSKKLSILAVVFAAIALSTLPRILSDYASSDAGNLVLSLIFITIPAILVGVIFGVISLIKSIRFKKKCGQRDTANFVISIVAIALSVITAVILYAYLATVTALSALLLILFGILLLGA